MSVADWFCPWHAFTNTPCSVWCVRVRQEFASSAADLERYWRSDERAAYTRELMRRLRHEHSRTAA